jgi:hypothetical protein
MITYEADYVVGTKPTLCKKIEVSDGSKISTSMTPSNKDELENFTDEQIIQHINNYILHVQNLSSDMYIFPDEEAYFHSIPINNFIEVEKCMQEMVQWIEYVLYRNPQEADLSHTHGEGDGHTHDPETGEEVPN